MAEEHHIDNFDPASFFSMHDFNSDGVWTPEEVQRKITSENAARLFGFELH